MKKTLLTIAHLTAIILGTTWSYAQTTASELVFNIDVTVSAAPSITLKWNRQTGVSSYNILKKTRSAHNFTTLASYVAEMDTTFTDNSVNIGEAYEYCVQSSANMNISGYVYAGIKLPAVHHAGEIMLLIDNTYQNTAATELENYTLDLIKEGWKVKSVFVSRTQSPASVKQLINDEYVLHPNELKGVILLGHVPVPYSGKIAPDAHSNHLGAWPCDMYYGDVSLSPTTNAWVDNSIIATTAIDSRNHNLIGDGKFDASNKATVSPVKLFVGRVDVYNMPAINSNDVVLFKQYLAKNHTYRASLKTFRNKGIIDDNFGFFSGEAFAQNGWRNFSSIVGAGNIEQGDYVVDTKANSYLWSYACGPGWYTGATGIGTTNDFTSNQMQSVFTMLYGSYFGDWDNTNNFLRAPIASPSSTLVSIWGGRPNWFLHTMTLGEPIGYSYINSVDNAGTYFPKGYYSNKIHQNLQGDPTLKMYMFEGPDMVAVQSDPVQGVMLSWAASTDAEVLGYYVYRSINMNGDYELLTPVMLTANNYVDNSTQANPQAFYMIKSVKLQQTNTGTFYNLSRGVMATPSQSAVALPVTVLAFTGQTNEVNTNSLFWTVQDEKNLLLYDLERSLDGNAFASIGSLTPTNSMNEVKDYSFVDVAPELNNYYRLRCVDLDGNEIFSKVLHLQRNAQQTVFTAYPSPFRSSLSIKYYSEQSTTLSIQVRNLAGTVLASLQKDVVSGYNQFELGELDRLPSGMYFLVARDAQHPEARVIKLLKE